LINFDERLIRKLKVGDREAQEACYISLSPVIYTTLIKICRDKETANDLLHDTFIQLFDTASTLDTSINIVPWVKRIAINKALNHIKRNRLNVVDIQFYSEKSEDPFENDSLDSLFETIPPEQRVVIWLFIVEEYSHREISRFLDKSESYSKSIVSRCLKKIRGQIGEIHESY